MRLPVVFILITVMIDAMGIGLILPVMPALILEVEGGSLARAALWGGVLSTGFAVMQFLFGPTVGSLSDRYGRRPVLLVSLAVMALDYLVMAVAGTIWLLLAGRLVGGITAATQSTAMAFMADISKPEDKAANFGLIGAAFGVGFVLGPLIGGLLAEWGTRAPFYAAAVLASANAVFGWFVMPETVTERTRRPLDWRRANPMGAFRHLSALPGLRPLLTLSFVYGVAFFVYPAIWAYFGQARFGWSPQVIGLSLAIYGISSAAVQAGLIRVMLRHLGGRRTVIWGLASDIIACVLDRPRHAELIDKVRETGAAIRLIGDGDIAGVIHTTDPIETGIDIYIGSGGAPEGVLASAALRCTGGQMQGRLILRTDEHKARAERMGITDFERIYTHEDMAKGDVYFAATGVTDGNMLQGVRFYPGYITTETVVMRSSTGTVRTIRAKHVDYSKFILD